MHDEPSIPAPAPPSRRGLWAKILASKFLVVSIAVHLLGGVGATLHEAGKFRFVGKSDDLIIVRFAGLPKLPLFRVADVSAPAHKKDMPPFATGGPVWKAAAKRTVLPSLVP